MSGIASVISVIGEVLLFDDYLPCDRSRAFWFFVLVEVADVDVVVLAIILNIYISERVKLFLYLSFLSY